MKVWLHHRLVDAKAARVSVFDHGFLYGDGIYETVHAYGFQIFQWPAHYERLLESAQRIELKCPWSLRTLEKRMVRLLQANQEPNGSVRITISRGPGPLGLSPSGCPTPTLAMMMHPKRDVERHQRLGVSIGIPKIRRNPPQALDPQIKSNNSLNTVLAKMEAEKMGVFEAILMNLNGELTEGTTSNIFLIQRGVLCTPALACGLLAGVTRKAVLDIARHSRIPVKEGRFSPRDLLSAQEAFLSSTTLEIAPIIHVKISGQTRIRPIGAGEPGALTRHIQALFRATLPTAVS